MEQEGDWEVMGQGQGKDCKRPGRVSEGEGWS